MNGEWEIVFWDVGQGDAATIRLPDSSFILIDSGPTVQQGNPLPAWFVRNGHPHIRLAVVTHSHSDHFGGLISLCRESEQRIETVMLMDDAALRQNSKPEDLENLLRELVSRKRSGATQVSLVNGAQELYSADGLRLRVAYPADISGIGKLPLDVNRTSMVIILECVNSDASSPMVVFGSDAPLAAIKATCAGATPLVFTGPHHGGPQGKRGKTPDYWRFFKDDMHPGCIFLSVGRSNGYQLPDPNYIKGAANAGITTCCSQLARRCDENRTVDVFEGSALVGIDKPAHSVQCRGALRVYASEDGIRFDENQSEFIKAVESRFPAAPCKNKTLQKSA